MIRYWSIDNGFHRAPPSTIYLDRRSIWPLISVVALRRVAQQQDALGLFAGQRDLQMSDLDKKEVTVRDTIFLYQVVYGRINMDG